MGPLGPIGPLGPVSPLGPGGPGGPSIKTGSGSGISPISMGKYCFTYEREILLYDYFYYLL